VRGVPGCRLRTRRAFPSRFPCPLARWPLTPPRAPCAPVPHPRAGGLLGHVVRAVQAHLRRGGPSCGGACREGQVPPARAATRRRDDPAAAAAAPRAGGGGTRLPRAAWRLAASRHAACADVSAFAALSLVKPTGVWRQAQGSEDRDRSQPRAGGEVRGVRPADGDAFQGRQGRRGQQAGG